MKFFQLLFALLLISLVSCPAPEVKKEPDRIPVISRAVVKCVRVESPRRIVVDYKGREIKFSMLGIITPRRGTDTYKRCMEHLGRIVGKEMLVKTFSETIEGKGRALIFYRAPMKQLPEYGKETDYPVHLNAQLIQLGYAKANLDEIPSDYYETYEAIQEEAKLKHGMIWQE